MATNLFAADPIRNMRDILQQTKLPVNIFKVVVKRIFADVCELKGSDCQILLAEQKNKLRWFVRKTICNRTEGSVAARHQYSCRLTVTHMSG